MNNKVQYGTNFPIFTVMGLIFITLKLTGHISWSWWWVLSPFWLPVMVAVSLIALVWFGCFVYDVFKGKK